MEKELRIVFMGTPEFAVASLDKLVSNNYQVIAVITSPDKPAGRGQKLQMSPVKEYALKKGLRVLQPTNLKSAEFLEELKALKANLQIVVAFRMLPETVWNMPELGTYNLHASLLPKYRGAAPINWCIINGDNETGVTTFKLSHEIDTGLMLLQEKVNIGDEMTAGELHDKLMELGSAVMMKTVELIMNAYKTNSSLPFVKQNEEHVTHAPKLFKDTCRINWNKSANEIYNLIRGLSPYPAAFTQFKDSNGNNLAIKIYRCRIVNNIKAEAGKLLTDNKTHIHIECSDGTIELLELQLQGKRKMNVREFLNGYDFPQPLYCFS